MFVLFRESGKKNFVCRLLNAFGKPTVPSGSNEN